MNLKKRKLSWKKKKVDEILSFQNHNDIFFDLSHRIDSKIIFLVSPFIIKALKIAYNTLLKMNI